MVSSAERWAKARTFSHTAYPPERLARERGNRTISVCLPARECAETITEIVQELVALQAMGVIDEVVVVDDSSDGTAALAQQAGATVHRQADLKAELGPVHGKGDAMWRALSILKGDVVCYLDADIHNFSPHLACGVLGPLICEDEISFVKAFYRRPFKQDGVNIPDGGGRVNHLLARPSLGLFYPDLAGVIQPLAGEVAVRRDLLEQIPFTTGYGVEIGMLIDIWQLIGLDGMAQVDLEERHDTLKSLAELVPMAQTVLSTVAVRLQREGRLMPEGLAASPALERPPLANLASSKSP